MTYQLIRIQRSSGGIIGRLYGPSGWACWTLVRDNEHVVPDGEYPIKRVNSPSQGPDSIWICREPEREYWRAEHHNLIHAGNYVGDSEGCELVGDKVISSYPFVGSSANTLGELKARVKDGDTIIIKTLWEV